MHPFGKGLETFVRAVDLPFRCQEMIVEDIDHDAGPFPVIGVKLFFALHGQGMIVRVTIDPSVQENASCDLWRMFQIGFPLDAVRNEIPDHLSGRRIAGQKEVSKKVHLFRR